jgi:hypothetical protein
MVPLAALVAASLLITVADGVPTLDARQSCHGASRGGNADQDLKNCMQEEQGARDALVKQWGNFTAADRRSCTEMATLGGLPSYVELLTCLEMAQAAKDIKDPTAPGGSTSTRRVR